MQTRIAIACASLAISSASPSSAIGLDESSDNRVKRIAATLRIGASEICENIPTARYIQPCGGDVRVVRSKAYNAWFQGSSILVTSRAVKESTDDELAFLIAHEMSHNILWHSGSTKQNEREADEWAVNLVMNTDYDVYASREVLKKGMPRSLFGFLFYSPTHPTIKRRMYAIDMQINRRFGELALLREMSPQAIPIRYPILLSVKY